MCPFRLKILALMRNGCIPRQCIWECLFLFILFAVPRDTLIKIRFWLSSFAIYCLNKVRGERAKGNGPIHIVKHVKLRFSSWHPFLCAWHCRNIKNDVNWMPSNQWRCSFMLSKFKLCRKNWLICQKYQFPGPLKKIVMLISTKCETKFYLYDRLNADDRGFWIGRHYAIELSERLIPIDYGDTRRLPKGAANLSKWADQEMGWCLKWASGSSSS